MKSLILILGFTYSAFAHAGNTPVTIEMAKNNLDKDLKNIGNIANALVESSCTIDPALLGPLATFSQARTKFKETLDFDYRDMMAFVTKPIEGNGQCDQSHWDVAAGAASRITRLSRSIDTTKQLAEGLSLTSRQVDNVSTYDSITPSCGARTNARITLILSGVTQATAATSALLERLDETKLRLAAFKEQNDQIAKACHDANGAMGAAANPEDQTHARSTGFAPGKPQANPESTVTGILKETNLDTTAVSRKITDKALPLDRDQNKTVKNNNALNQNSTVATGISGRSPASLPAVPEKASGGPPLARETSSASNDPADNQKDPNLVLSDFDDPIGKKSQDFVARGPGEAENKELIKELFGQIRPGPDESAPPHFSQAEDTKYSLDQENISPGNPIFRQGAMMNQNEQPTLFNMIHRKLTDFAAKAK